MLCFHLHVFPLFGLLCVFVNGYNWKYEVETLQNDVEALYKHHDLEKHRLDILEKQLKNVHTEFLSNSYTKLINRREKAFTDSVKPAFSARLSHRVGNLGDFQVIVFDDVVTNQGNTYDSRTGIFSCPEDGVYVFHTSIVSVPGCQITTQIAKNSQPVAWTFSMDPVNASSGSNLAVLSLHSGDIVEVRLTDHHDYRNPQIAQLYCSFSGFRLY